MSKCKVEIEVEVIDFKKLKEKVGKNPKFDNIMYNNDEGFQNKVKDFFTGSNTKKAMSSLKELVKDRQDVKESITALLNPTNTSYKALKEFVGTTDNFDGEKAIDTTIAMKYILDSMETEKALQANNNISKKNIDAMNINGPSVFTGRLYSTIGRAIAEAKGMKAVQGKITPLEAYTAMGRAAIKDLVDRGIVDIVSDGTWIANKMVDSNNDPVASKGTGGVLKGETLVLNSKFIDPKTREFTEDVEKANTVIRQLSKLIESGRETLPTLENQGYVDQVHDVTHSQEMRDLLHTMGSSKFKLNPRLKGILDYVHDEYVKAGNDEIAFRNQLKKVLGKDFLKDVFGLKFRDDSLEIMSESDKGKELSKIKPLIGLMENYDTLGQNPFYFTQFMAGNSRLFVYNNILNYQSDNFFSRHALTSAEATTYKGKKEIDNLIRRITVEYGIDPEVILGNKKSSNGTLENMLEILNSNDIKDKDKLLSVYKAKNKTGIMSKGKPAKFWKQMNILNAIAEIQKSYKDSGGKSVTTGYMVEADATASGLFIKILQSSSNPKVQAIANRLTKGDANALDDAYQLALETVQKDFEEINKGKINKDVVLEKEQQLKDLEALGSFIGLDIEGGKNTDALRELVKYPIMQFAYHQADYNNKTSLGKDLALEIMAGDADTLVKAIEYYGIEKYSDLTDVNSLNANQQMDLRERLATKIAETSGKYLVDDVLNTTYKAPIFADNEKNLETLFNYLIESTNKLISTKDNDVPQELDGVHAVIADPYEYVRLKELHGQNFDYSKVLTKYKRALDKKKETLLELNQGVKSIIKKYQPNITSIHVLPIHMIDAAVLLRATKNTLEILGIKEEIPNNGAMMHIHDAYMSNANFVRVFEQEYEKEVVTVNQHYDVAEVFALEVEQRAKQSNTTIPAEVKEVIKQVKENAVKRAKYMSSVNQNNGSFATDISDAAVQESIVTLPGSKQQSIPTEVKPKTKQKVTAKQARQNSFMKLLNIKSMSELSKYPQYKSILEFFNSPIASNIIFEFKPMSKGISTEDNFNYEVTDFPLADLVTETIYYDDSATIEDKVKYLSHEVEHAKTYGYISTLDPESKDYKYITKVIERVSLLQRNDKFSEAINDRINKFTGVKNSRPIEAIAEFVAIMNTEPEVRNEVYKALNSNVVESNLKSILRRIAKAIKNFVLTDKHIADLDKQDIDITVLGQVLGSITNKGKDYRVNQGIVPIKLSAGKISIPKIEYTPPKVENDLNDPLSQFVTGKNAYVSDLIVNGAVPRFKTLGGLGYEAFDKWANDSITIYPKFKGLISETWSNNTTMVKLKEYILPDGKLAPVFNDIMSKYLEAKQDSIYEMDTMTAKLNKKLKKAYKSENDIAKLDTIIAKSGIFSLMNNGVLGKLLSGDSLASHITALEAKVGIHQNVAKGLSHVYQGKSTVGLVNPRMNVHDAGIPDSKIADVEALASLYVLQDTSGSVGMLKEMYTKHNDLFNELTHLSRALKAMDTKLAKRVGSPSLGKGNLINDNSSDPMEVHTITEEDLGKGFYQEDNGWQILRKPDSKGKVGLVYRKTDRFIQESNLGLSTSYMKSGIKVRKEVLGNIKYANNTLNGFVNNRDNNPTIQFTAKEKETLGMIQNPVESLLRSYAHKELLLETQGIRDFFVDGMTYKASKDLSASVKTIRASLDRDEHPPFIKLPKGKTIADLKALDPKVASKYVVPKKHLLSDVGGFRNEVSLVRKDISDKVNGYDEIKLFNSYKMERWADIHKKMVAFAKIGMIILNPVKIAADFGAGISVAASKGASLQEIWKYSKEASVYNKEITDLRNKRIQARISALGRGVDPSIDTTVLALDKKIKDHPFSGALANGYIQSLGTELLVKDRDAISGLQTDIDSIVNKIMKDDKDKATAFNKAVMLFAKKFPIHMDQLYLALGDKLEQYKGTKSVGEIVTNMGDRLKNIKSEEDATKYMSELIGAPNSSLVSLGGALTLYADLLPRWIIYRHNLNAGMSEQEAVMDTIQALPDYKIQMPAEMKWMSDMFFSPFPSFFTRITTSAINIGVKQPVSFMMGLASGEYLGTPNIYNSTIIGKYAQDMIFTNPLDIMTSDNLLLRYGNFIP